MNLPFTKTHIPQSYAARSDVGSVREHNEDSYLARSPLFVVADGMGGHEAGEVASSIAVETMASRAPKTPNPQRLASAVVAANEAVINGAKNGIGKPGMGTTLTAATVIDDEVTIAQVGDSRAYLLHDGELQRITRDHSLMAELIEQGRLTEAEARFHPQRSVITRALGSDPGMQPDTYTLHVEYGDRLMLCSDGLSSMVSDDIIESVLLENPDPAQACDALVEEALAAGGLDNVTVIVIEPLDEPLERDAEDLVELADTQQIDIHQEELYEYDYETEPAIFEEPEIATIEEPPAIEPKQKKKAEPKQERVRRPRQKGRLAPLGWAIAFVLILIAAGLGFYAYAQNSYFLIAQEGVVSVYRGLPGEIGTFQVSWLEEQAPDIDVTLLHPTTQNRLKNGISVNSIEEADNLISEYRQTVANAKRAQESATASIAAGSSTGQSQQSSGAGPSNPTVLE